MPARRNPLPAWVLAQRDQTRLRIAALRNAKGWSQDNLAEAVGVDRRTIQRYEKGTREPKLSDLLLIAAALDTTVADLAGES